MLAFFREGQYDTDKLIKVAVGSMILPDFVESAKSLLVDSGVSFSERQLRKIHQGIAKSSSLARELNDALTQYISSRDNPTIVLDLQAKMTRIAERLDREVREAAQQVIYKEPVRYSSRYH